jgi:ankyrin repeat protein
MPDTGSTPIMYAAQEGHMNIVTVLLEHGADITIKNSSGNDVYYYAKDSKKVDISIIIKEFQDKKEKEELLMKNMLLEQQCQDMNNKLNYLLGAFEKMQVNVPDDFTHKKCKAIDN